MTYLIHLLSPEGVGNGVGRPGVLQQRPADDRVDGKINHDVAGTTRARYRELVGCPLDDPLDVLP